MNKIWEDKFKENKEYKDNILIKKLCNILHTINWEYTQKIKDLLDDPISDEDNENKNGVLPIGLLSSGFLGNYYLKEFDDDVIDKLNPSYYGRYVDDILFVFADRKINFKVEDPTIDFLDKYFIKSAILDKNTLPDYNLYNKPNLIIQQNKIILEHFLHKESRAAINKFKANLDKQRSEFRFLPDEDEVENDFDNNAFLLQYSDSVNKLRSIEEYREDRFGASKFLANKIFLSRYSNEEDIKIYQKKFDKSSKQILTFFKGRVALDFHTLWEKVATYFIINDEMKYLDIFINQVNKSIESMEYKENTSSLTKLKEDLNEFLKISVSIPLSMTDENTFIELKEKEILYYRYSNLFRHNLVGIDGINYTSKLYDLRYNLYNTDIHKI